MLFTLFPFSKVLFCHSIFYPAFDGFSNPTVSRSPSWLASHSGKKSLLPSTPSCFSYTSHKAFVISWFWFIVRKYLLSPYITPCHGDAKQKIKHVHKKLLIYQEKHTCTQGTTSNVTKALHEVSQPWHCGHFEPGKSLLCVCLAGRGPVLWQNV